MANANTRAKVKTWMRQHCAECVDDRRTGEVNYTKLAEEAADTLGLYADEVDYEVPDWVYDLAVDVGNAYEAKYNRG